MEPKEPGHYYWDGDKFVQVKFCWKGKDLAEFFERGHHLENTDFRVGFDPNEKFGLKVGPVAGEEVAGDAEGVTSYNVVTTCPPLPPTECL